MLPGESPVARRGLSLRTLIILRWMAIAGQTAAVLFVHYVLQFELPLAACLAAVGASAWLNVALMAVFPSQHLSSPQETAGQLAFDTVQVAVLIGLTGQGLSDQRVTALGEMVPGIDIQAQSIEALFDGRMLLRPWWMKWLSR